MLLKNKKLIIFIILIINLNFISALSINLSNSYNFKNNYNNSLIFNVLDNSLNNTDVELINISLNSLNSVYNIFRIDKGKYEIIFFINTTLDELNLNISVIKNNKTYINNTKIYINNNNLYTNFYNSYSINITNLSYFINSNWIYILLSLISLTFIYLLIISTSSIKNN